VIVVAILIYLGAVALSDRSATLTMR